MGSRRSGRRRVYRQLLAGYAASENDGSDAEARWAWLMAAHVVGQAALRLHLHSHWRMLGLAWALRDGRELAGQLFRLALVPLGHALQRLPAGNVGRTTVNAFRPMRPGEEVRRLIALAQHSRPVQAPAAVKAARQ